jgi:hypothetical protein
MMVLASGLDALEAGQAFPEVDAAQEAQVGQLLERAIDARDADRASRRTEAFEHLLRGQAAVLPGEVLDHRFARRAGTRAGAAELLASA